MRVRVMISCPISSSSSSYMVVLTNLQSSDPLLRYQQAMVPELGSDRGEVEGPAQMLDRSTMWLQCMWDKKSQSAAVDVWGIITVHGGRVGDSPSGLFFV